ncbi:MAG: hypothetical protein HY298_01510 [Verrucomicrobia bacterium]|nr:hypothetical protein [Verrucomicrobiota bacterium]
MKNMKWFALIASVALPLLAGYSQAPVAQAPTGPEQSPPTGTAPTNVSPSVAEVIKLAESGVGEDVILSFIQNSKSTYDLSADDVFYLKDVGLSSPVITAMLNHDKALGNQSQQYAPTLQTPAAPAAVEAPATPPAAPAPTYVSNPPVEVNYFYNDLSPYGTWVVIDGYGWCWQPRAVVINRGWRPYCDGGHWIYSDAGWYWASDYSWGWAPFHYGRWYLDARCGWVWLPDRVWAPAWVTWRVAGDSCGWAPLPPHATFDVGVGWRFNGVHVGVNFDFGLHFDHFVFIGLGDFCDRDIRRRCYPVTRVKNVYKNTTIINNTTVVNNNTIVNRGVAVEKVSAASHTEIRKASIREMPAGAGKGLRMQASDKNAPIIYRPQLKAPERPVKVVAQKLDARHPVIQHTAIAATKIERKSETGNSGTTSVFTPRKSQTETPGAPQQRSRGAKSPASPQNQPGRRNYQPPRNAPSAPTPSRPSEERKQPTRSGPAERSEAGPTPNPVQAYGQGRANSGLKDSWRQNQQYYPKGFYQSSEGRSRSKGYERQEASPRFQSNDRQDSPASRSGKDKDRPN